MENLESKEIFAVLKTENHNFIGQVSSISNTDLVFKSASIGDIHVNSDQHKMDVFTKGHIFGRDLPVKVVSVNESYDKRSFSKMVTREIKVAFNNHDAEHVLVPMAQRR